MDLTDVQNRFLHLRNVKKSKEVLAGKSSFGMDDYQCRRYFNVTNETIHEPCCWVTERDEKSSLVYVKAVFYGSGVLSNPLRKAWIPEREILLGMIIPWRLYWWFIIGNYWKSLVKKTK